MRAVAYCRVSTDQQAAEGVSLEAQESRIRAWCQLEGHALADSDIHVDRGLSGKSTAGRPALAAALDSVCSGGGVLVVYSLSRLARSTRDTLDIGDRLDRAGADLASLSERIDTTTAAGKMIFRLLAVLAEFERDQLVERTRAAVEHKRAKGERLGQIPFGSVLGPDGSTLVPCPAELATLGRIRAEKLEGLSLRVIARRLNADGLVAKNGGPWTHSTVDQLLKRPA